MIASPSPAPFAVRAFAWLGGAAFVASLAYFIYFHAVRLDVTVDGGPGVRSRRLIVDTVLFGIFAAHHSVMARSGAKRWITRVVPPSLERSVYVWVASGLFVLACFLWLPIPGHAYYRLTGTLGWLARAVQAAGVILIGLSARALNGLELAGICQATGSSPIGLFRVAGPYRWVRHPVYLGWMMVVFGASDMTPSRLAFASISSGYLLLAMTWEERSLIEQFGDPYREYAARVRWRMVPYVF